MTLRKKFSLLPVIEGVFVFLLILSINSCSSGGTENQPGDESSVRVEGYRVNYEPFTIQIRSTGELLPNEQVEIRTPVAGNVFNIYFKEGQFVQKGALLVEIDSRTWKAQKNGLEAQLLSAENELGRKKQLLEIEGTSQEEIDHAEALVSSLQAQIEEMDVRIDLAHIHAPFSGRLGMRDFSQGAYLSQGDVITQLVQSNKIKVNFDIPARYASLAFTDMEVMVISSARNDTVKANIYAVDPFINPDNRSLNIRAIIDNQDQKFISGDFTQVIFNVQVNEEAILIPSESIISELNAQVVYLAHNGKAKRHEIEIGQRTRERVVVLSGIAPGDTVLTTGLLEIRDGSNIEVTKLNQEVGL